MPIRLMQHAEGARGSFVMTTFTMAEVHESKLAGQHVRCHYISLRTFPNASTSERFGGRLIKVPDVRYMTSGKSTCDGNFISPFHCRGLFRGMEGRLLDRRRRESARFIVVETKISNL